MENLHVALIGLAVAGAGFVGYAAYEASCIKPGDRVTVTVSKLQAPELRSLNNVLVGLGFTNTNTIDVLVSAVNGNVITGKIANLTGRPGVAPEMGALQPVSFDKSAVTHKVKA